MLLLRAHQAAQQAEQAAAGDRWHNEAWVFASPTGQPLNPNSDYYEWKQLLKDAGLREARLHDARHTAATVLLALGQPTPTVMSLMGWSSESMAARYQHVTDAIRTDVASQVGALTWRAGVATDRDRVIVGRDSLAAVLAFATEKTAHASGRIGRPELLAAISDLQAALEPERAPTAPARAEPQLEPGA